MTDAITERLDRAVADYPLLSELRAAIPTGLAITPAFVEAYHAAEHIPVDQKALLLRALFADPSLGIPSPPLAPPEGVLDRLVEWWQANGALEGGGYARNYVPKCVSHHFGESRTFDRLVSRIGVEPHWQRLCGGSISHPAIAAVALESGEAMARLFTSRVLTQPIAAVLAHADGKRSPARGTWFFDTGVAALDLRNALLFFAELFQERDGGKAQSRIPAALSNRWGLRRVSLTDAQAFADVAVLVLSGMADMERAPSDPLGLAAIVQTPGAQEFVGGTGWHPDQSVQRAVAALTERSVCTANMACRIERMRAEGLRGGVYDTSVLFNARRLYGTGEWTWALPYISAVSAAGVLAGAGAVWATIDPTLPARIARLPALGIRKRDLGNILAYLVAHHADLHDVAAVWRLLPAVARFALGAVEPVARPAAGVGRRRAVRGIVGGESVGDLPDLEGLREPAPAAWLLTPSYCGEIPRRARVLVHAAHAAAFHAPPGVEVIGRAPVPWGSDPLVELHAWAAAQGLHCIVLK